MYNSGLTLASRQEQLDEIIHQLCYLASYLTSISARKKADVCLYPSGTRCIPCTRESREEAGCVCVVILWRADSCETELE